MSSQVYEITITAPRLEFENRFNDFNWTTLYNPYQIPLDLLNFDPGVILPISEDPPVVTEDDALIGSLPLAVAPKAIDEIITRAPVLKSFDKFAPAANDLLGRGVSALSRFTALSIAAQLIAFSPRTVSQEEEEAQLLELNDDGKVVLHATDEIMTMSDAVQVTEEGGYRLDLDPTHVNMHPEDGIEASITRARNAVNLNIIGDTDLDYTVHSTENDLQADSHWQEAEFNLRNSALERAIDIAAEQAIQQRRGFYRLDPNVDAYPNTDIALDLLSGLSRVSGMRVDAPLPAYYVTQYPYNAPQDVIPPFRMQVNAGPKGEGLQLTYALSRGPSPALSLNPARQKFEKDKKIKSQLMYMAALRFINSTWGRVSEGIDAVNVLQDSTLFKRDTVVRLSDGRSILVRKGQRFSSLPVEYRLAMLKRPGALIESTYVDYQTFMLNFMIDQLSDLAIAKVAQLETSLIRNHPVLGNMLGNPSTWLRRFNKLGIGGI